MRRHRQIITLLLIVVAAMSSACSDSKSPTTPSVTTSGTMALSGDFSFGSVTVGSSVDRTLTISNGGSEPFTITQVETMTDVTVTPDTFPTLAPGASTTLTLTFRPLTATFYTGTLTVTSTAPNSPVALPMSGTGTTPAPLMAIGGDFAYGNVAVGSTLDRTLTISNIGAVAFIVTQIQTMPGVIINSDLPTVAAGDSVSLTLTFAPAFPTTYVGTLTVTSTASNSPLTAPMSGRGT